MLLLGPSCRILADVCVFSCCKVYLGQSFSRADQRKLLPDSPCCGLFQVAPSFFDAPGAQGSSHTALPAATSAMPAPSPAASPQLSDDQLPNITFAFASQVGYKVSHDFSHAAGCLYIYIYTCLT